MERRYSPEEHLLKLTQDWLGTVLIIGAILFPALQFMDLFVSPDKFMRFMLYRLVISFIFVILYYVNRLKRARPTSTASPRPPPPSARSPSSSPCSRAAARTRPTTLR